MGGYVAMDRVNGLLAVSRSFGDIKYGCVNPEPSIQEYKLTGQEHFLLLACDGLTDVLQPLDILNVVQMAAAGGISDAKSVSKLLIDEALKRGSTDNISVIFVPLEFHQDNSTVPTGDVLLQGLPEISEFPKNEVEEITFDALMQENYVQSCVPRSVTSYAISPIVQEYNMQEFYVPQEPLATDIDDYDPAFAADTGTPPAEELEEGPNPVLIESVIQASSSKPAATPQPPTVKKSNSGMTQSKSITGLKAAASRRISHSADATRSKRPSMWTTPEEQTMTELQALANLSRQLAAFRDQPHGEVSDVSGQSTETDRLDSDRNAKEPSMDSFSSDLKQKLMIKYPDTASSLNQNNAGTISRKPSSGQ